VSLILFREVSMPKNEVTLACRFALLLLSSVMVSSHLHAAESTSTEEAEKLYFIVLGNETDNWQNDFPARHPEEIRQVAFSPMMRPMRQSTAQLEQKVIDKLDFAEESGYPVCFHIDDWNYPPMDNDTNPSPEEWRNDPEMIEWTAFPEGGETNGPLLMRRWLNWGTWEILSPSPNFESPKFRELMRTRISDGIANPIATRVEQWKQEGRSYLFAGIVVGWETGYYTMDQNVPGMEPGEEDVNTGYAALHARGHSAASVAQVAEDEGITVAEAHQLLMNDVKHDYTEFLARTVHDCGISTNRIYTHYPQAGFGPYHEHYAPLEGDGRKSPIEVTMNPYCQTGVTGTDIEGQEAMLELLQENGRSKFGMVELNFFPELLQEEYAFNYFNTIFDHGATMITIFDWWGGTSGQPGTVAGIQRWLDDERTRPARSASAGEPRSHLCRRL